MKFMLVGLLNLQFIFAINLTPMVHEIGSLKKRNITYRISNPEKSLAAVECKILEVVGHDKLGQEIRKETTDMVLYPSQFILKAETSRNLRLNYIKKFLPKKQKVYRVIANQLALNLTNKSKSKDVQAGVKFLYSYEGLLFVGGDNSDITLQAQIKAETADGFILDLSNKSLVSAFVHVNHFDFYAQTNKGEIKLGKKDFGKMKGIRLLADETFIWSFHKDAALKGLQLKGMRIVHKKK